MRDQITKIFEDTTISIQFSSEDIIDVVHGFKRSSSCGPDDISINYIKDAIEELAPIFKFIYDKAALFAKTPHQWKTAKIIPIHKKGKTDNPENYRPISLLFSIGKIFEKCVLNLMSAPIFFPAWFLKKSQHHNSCFNYSASEQHCQST